MSKRKYTKIKGSEKEIFEMKGAGKTHREIADYLGIKDKNVVKNCVKRYRAKQRKLEKGIKINPKGRPSTKK